MTTIAIFRTGGIGDVILSTVAINILQDAIPAVNIHWFGYSSTTPFIKKAFPQVHTHDLDREAGYSANIALVKKSAPGAQLVLDLQRSARTMIIGRAVALHFKCPYITWNKYSVHRTLLVIQSFIRGRRTNIDLFPKPLPNRYEAMATCTLRGVNKLGIEDISVSKRYVPKIATGVKRSVTTFAVNMGALYKSKELPLQKLRTIIDDIAGNGVSRIFLLGDNDKYAEGEELVRTYGRDLIENLCGKTTLWEAAQVLAKCTLSIGNDSALCHLSEAVGTPVVMFFGPTDEKFGYRPQLAQSRSFSVDLSCRPCTKGGHTNCRYRDFRCMNEMNMHPVSEYLAQLQPAVVCEK